MGSNAKNQGGNVRVAMVGSGFAAKFHAENLRRVHGVNVELAGIFSRRKEAAQKFAGDYSVEKVYDSLDELLKDPQVDLVDVVVSTHAHEEMVLKVLQAGKHVAVEKPFTGCFERGKNDKGWERCLTEALASADRMLAAEKESGKRIHYAENWVYAPGIQKAKRLLEAADTPVLRFVAEESHSGTHSRYNMEWKTSGGGSLLNKGCHPAGGALYLKQEEGKRRLGRPIRPRWVTASVANLTHSEAFKSNDVGLIRTGWVDCEDWGTMIIGFEDGSVAQITAADTVLGGIQNMMSIFAKRVVLHVNINPNTAVLSYASDGDAFESEYLREKAETKAGWQFTNPDEDWMTGYPDELQDFCEAVAEDRPPLADSRLGRDVTAVSYAAYLSAFTGKRAEVPSD